MARSALFYLVVGVIALSFAPQVLAFGAGNIPSYSYLEEKAFRHGDIEDVIGTMYKVVGSGFLSRGTKFSGLDLKRVYFGNWLRDYSQAVDVASLSKVPLQTVLNVVMVLGFLAHGYATEEFEVTKERLGTYLPTEHIDNPKGYAEGEDPRKYDPRLRPPIDPRELEIDPRTGMKNYIANENGSWQTSKGLVRETLMKCVDLGRRHAQSGNKADQYEAFRLLGTALHTLEDFTAHSNFCELSLISMGQQDVFPHVGNNCRMQAPNGKHVFPLITGTFGGADFIHSLMGEAGDHLSSAAVSDLSKSVSNSRDIGQGQNKAADDLRSMFFSLPSSGNNDLSREMDELQNIRANTQDPSTMSPQELHATLWRILSFRDSVMKRVEMTMEKIPGLNALTEKIGNSVSVFVMTTIEPFVKPLLGTATQTLASSSQAILDAHAQDQFEVWVNPNASDPTHSFLSKDHFAVLLNEPAGQIAQIIVKFAVERIVHLWSDARADPRGPIEEILQCLFHPDFGNGAQIQGLMLGHMRKWWDEQGHNQREVVNRLSANSVKEGKNKRLGDNSASTGHVHNQMLPQGGLQEVLSQHNVHVPGSGILNAGQDLLSGKMPWQPGFGQGTAGGAQAWREMPEGGPNTQASGGYGRTSPQPPSSGYGRTSPQPPSSGYGGASSQSGYGGQSGFQPQGGYGGSHQQEQHHSRPAHHSHGSSGFQPDAGSGFQPDAGSGFQPSGGFQQHQQHQQHGYGGGGGRHGRDDEYASGFQPQGGHGQGYGAPQGGYGAPPGQGYPGSGYQGGSGGGYGGGGGYNNQY